MLIKYVDQSFEIITPLTPEIGANMVKNVETTARVCCHSDIRPQDGVDPKLVNRLMKGPGIQMFEHGSVQVHIVTSRAIVDEIIMGGGASYTRAHIKYTRGNVNRIDVVRGYGWNADHSEVYDRTYRYAAEAYHMLLNLGAQPQCARDVLPLALATSLMVTANLREWMRMFRQHTDPAAHPDMVVLVGAILKEFRINIPFIYEEKYRTYWS
jgi:thymidylate synthase (FAD)